MKKYLMLTLAAAILSSGCATMINGSTQTVEIKSNQETAKIFINDEFVGTHQTAQLLKKNQDYTFKAEKEGCTTATLKAEKEFDKTTLLGLLIDAGIISIGAIDYATTGAFQKFSSEEFNLQVDCPLPEPKGIVGILVEDKKDFPKVDRTESPFLTQQITTTIKTATKEQEPAQELKPAIETATDGKSKKILEKELDAVFEN